MALGKSSKLGRVRVGLLSALRASAGNPLPLDSLPRLCAAFPLRRDAVRFQGGAVARALVQDLVEAVLAGV